MRIVMISKAVVVGIYQRKLEEIGKVQDVELSVIAPPSWRDPSGDVPLERAYTRGYNLLVEPIRFNGNFHFYHFPTLARLLHDLKPDIVHIDEEPYNFSAWHSLYHARQVKAKTLFFTWQNILKRYPIPFSWGEQYVFDRVDYGIAGTQSAAEVFRTKGYRGPMAVIPQFGVDPDDFSPITEPILRSSIPFVLGYIGRLVPEKGIDLLIRALPLCDPDCRLDVIGQGPERAGLEQLAKSLKVSDQVRFIGQVPSTQMPTFYRSLDALVIPSRTLSNWKEQFGRVITEAMACGVPVIGSSSGAIPDVIGDAGLVFPENNLNALVEQIKSLMGSAALRQSLAAKGRAHVLANYTHAQIAAQTVAIYRELTKIVI